jgi:hypothetical protein
MAVVKNKSFAGRSDMIAAIRALQIELGRPVCSAIDDQAIGQQIVLLQKYLSTVPDGGQPSGFKFDPANVRSNIADHTFPGAIIFLQNIMSGTNAVARFNTIAEIGDSRDTWMLDTPLRQKGGTDLMNIACGLSFQKYKALGVAGISGKRADEYIAAGQAAVLALNPGVLWIPSVLNTIGQDYPTQSTSGAQAASDTIGLANAALAEGVYVVIGSEVGQVGIADVRRDQIDIYNNTMQTFASGRVGVSFCDLRPTMCDANRKLITGYSYDGTHFNQLGAMTAAPLLKAVLDAITPVGNDYRLQANALPLDNAGLVQLLPNPLFNTITGGSTSTGATGTFAGSCTFNKTGAGSALAVTSAAQNVLMTGTFGAQGDNVRMSQVPPIGNWASGMKVRAMALVNVASPVGLAGVQLSMVATGDSVATTFADMSVTQTWAGPNGGYDMLLLTNEYVIPSYAVKNSLVATVTAIAFAAGGVAMTVKQLGVIQNTG